MNKLEIIKIVTQVVKEYLETQNNQTDINEYTPLVGENAALDSMGLVNIIIDIESRFLDKDIEISLASEKAMSRKNSPFRNISSLVDFISEQIGEDNE